MIPNIRRALETPILIRTDEAENLVRSAYKSGELTRDLSPTLMAELAGKELLRPLLMSRLHLLVLNQIREIDVESVQENKDKASTGQQSKVEDDDPRLAELAIAWFEPQVERYFLGRRDSLEKVSFRLLRTIEKGIALEAYQRLLNQEEDWATISDRWGMNPEKRFNGRYGPTQPQRLSPELVTALRRLKPREICSPLRLGKLFAIAELEEWRSVELDETLRKELAIELLQKWFNDQLESVLEEHHRNQAKT